MPNKDNPKFGIRLKSFGNKGWHECRIGKLEEALKQLIKIFKDKANISDEDKKALEYIRYLFKDFAFRDEEEFRLLKIEQIGSDKIEYCPTTKSVYLTYADISDIVVVQYSILSEPICSIFSRRNYSSSRKAKYLKL